VGAFTIYVKHTVTSIVQAAGWQQLQLPTTLFGKTLYATSDSMHAAQKPRSKLKLVTLHPVVVDVSSDDNTALSSYSNDGFSPILIPPGFQPASVPPHGNMLVTPDPAGQQMIEQHILFKWPSYGWCLGKISAWSSNPKCMVCKQIVNFYHDDSSFGPHCLLLDKYNIDIDFPSGFFSSFFSEK